MKITKEQARANRRHVVETAARLFREHGYDGVGVATLMAAAGFTHGGFYKQFASKAELIAEAAAIGLQQTAERSKGSPPGEFLRKYLSREHRDAPADGCSLAAMCGDAARQDPMVKAVFADGLESLLENLERDSPQPDEGSRQRARARRLSNIAHAVGALLLSRACPDDSLMADEILEACRLEILPKKT
ncbi:TetR family transcriptional regulator [bacterium SCN 62-11]|nr:TetR/AcrR family transcriptional regulator [Candidatus Eremiobacteraeota bacterium]ODT82845.1 MAG: TetR family transcriptional regulator [bacterium SCN 62-11]